MKIKTLILSMLIVCLSLFTFSGCNESLGFGNYNFNKAHIYLGGEKGVCVEVDSWHDNEIGVELKLKDGKGTIYCSEGTYMMVENYCPICGK